MWGGFALSFTIFALTKFSLEKLSFAKFVCKVFCFITMEHHTSKNVHNFCITDSYSYLETSGGQSSNLYLNVFHFLNTV